MSATRPAFRAGMRRVIPVKVTAVQGLARNNGLLQEVRRGTSSTSSFLPESKSLRPMSSSISSTASSVGEMPGTQASSTSNQAQTHTPTQALRQTFYEVPPAAFQSKYPTPQPKAPKISSFGPKPMRFPRLTSQEAFGYKSILYPICGAMVAGSYLSAPTKPNSANTSSLLSSHQHTSDFASTPQKARDGFRKFRQERPASLKPATSSTTSTSRFHRSSGAPLARGIPGVNPVKSISDTLARTLRSFSTAQTVHAAAAAAGSADASIGGGGAGQGSGASSSPGTELIPHPPSPNANPDKGHFTARSVMIAVAGNVIVCIGKFTAAWFSGSGVMFAEALHSLADVFNQSLLMLGLHQSAKEPSQLHPYGHAPAKFAYALISATGVFFLGCGMSLYHGLGQLAMGAHEIEFSSLTIGVLAGSFVVEMYTLVYASKTIRQLAQREGAGGMSFLQYLRRGTDTTAIAVVVEDLVAVIGIFVAMLALTLTYITGDCIWDTIGTLLVACGMGVVAFFLIKRNMGILVGRSLEQAELSSLHDFLRSRPSVLSVHDIKTVTYGDSDNRFKAELQFHGRQIAKQVLIGPPVLPADIFSRYDRRGRIPPPPSVTHAPMTVPMTDGAVAGRLILHYLTTPGKKLSKPEAEEWVIRYGSEVVHEMGREVDSLESSMKHYFPYLTHVDLESHVPMVEVPYDIFTYEYEGKGAGPGSGPATSTTDVFANENANAIALAHAKAHSPDGDDELDLDLDLHHHLPHEKEIEIDTRNKSVEASDSSHTHVAFTAFTPTSSGDGTSSTLSSGNGASSTPSTASSSPSALAVKVTALPSDQLRPPAVIPTIMTSSTAPQTTGAPTAQATMASISNLGNLRAMKTGPIVSTPPLTSSVGSSSQDGLKNTEDVSDIKNVTNTVDVRDLNSDVKK